MSRAKHLANVVVGQLNTVIAMSGSLIVTPAVLHGLGDSGYGGWLLINSFIGYMRFLDLGATAGTVKFAAGAYQRGDKKALADTLNTSAAISLVVGIAAILVTLGLVWILPFLYPAIASDQMSVIVMLGGAMTIEMCFRPFVATLRMRSLYYVYDAIEIGTYSTFKFGFVLYYAYTGGLSYRVLAAITLGETLVRLVLVFGGAIWASPAARKINPLGARRNMVGKIAGIGVAVSIMMVADIVRFQLDAGVIGLFMPDRPENIAIFGLGARLVSMAKAVIGVIAGVLVPRFSGLQETGDEQGTTTLLQRASLFTGLACVLILVNLAVLGPQFLALWLKTPWAHESGTILMIMLPGYWLALLATPSQVMLLGRAKLRGLTILIVAEALANVVLSVLLIGRFGIIGVALGTVIPLGLFNGILFPVLLKKDFGMSVGAYWRLHLPALRVGAVYLVLIGGLVLMPIPSYLRFMLLCVGTVLVFAALTLALVPTVRKELQRARAKVRSAPVSEPPST